jgi:hypothetical protein
MENVSFIDASKPEILEKETIIIKISDPKNGFKYIGKLTTNKFKVPPQIPGRKSVDGVSS